MKDVTPSIKTDLANQAQHEEFFTQDKITISVQSVYQRLGFNPANDDRMALITQLKAIAQAKGYNVSETTSQFTKTRYIHFKKYRLEAKAPEPQKTEVKPESVVLEVDDAPPRIT